MYIKNIDTGETIKCVNIEDGFKTLGIPKNKLTVIKPFYNYRNCNYVTAPTSAKLIFKEVTATTILNSTMKVYAKGEVILELLVHSAKKILGKSPDMFYRDTNIFYRHERVTTSIKSKPNHSDFELEYIDSGGIDICAYPAESNRKKYNIIK